MLCPCNRWTWTPFDWILCKLELICVFSRRRFYAILIVASFQQMTLLSMFVCENYSSLTVLAQVLHSSVLFFVFLFWQQLLFQNFCNDGNKKNSWFDLLKLKNTLLHTVHVLIIVVKMFITFIKKCSKNWSSCNLASICVFFYG